MFLEITRPYDSHIHLLGVGQRCSIHCLESKSSMDLLRLPQIPQRGNFIMGFGFSLNDEDLQKVLSKVDQVYSHHPIFFSRWDGHASLVNSQAALFLGLGQVAKILQEKEHFLALQKLPPFTDLQLEKILKEALIILNKEGFTHFRDMTSSEQEFNAWSSLFQKEKPTGYIQFYFLINDPEEIADKIDLLKRLKLKQTHYLKVNGLKVFIDGTLGSGTADTKCLCQHQESHWQKESLVTLLKETWSAGFEVAFHCIGELAVEKVVDAARNTLVSGVTGRLHIEHAELMSQQTLQKLKGLHCAVHIQPSHAIDDIEKIKTDLKDNHVLVFPVENLRQANIPVFFGSDAPIVSPSFQKTVQGLEKILKPNKHKLIPSFLKQHENPQSSTPFSKVYLNSDYKPVKLIFEDQTLFDETITT